jgi:hypothetical protein
VVEFIETQAGNFHSKKLPKSSDLSAEEILVKLDRHGFARYRKDRWLSVMECIVLNVVEGW